MSFLRRMPLFAALLALLGAAPVRAPAPLYPGASAAWTGPLGAALRSPGLTASLTPGLAALDLASPAGLRAASPLVSHLESSLRYTPDAFAALPASERAAAVQLAAEAAREELQQKVYELSERARDFSRRDALDREARAELYGVVAHLSELRDHYRGFLDDTELAQVEGGYSAAAGKAWSVRQALLSESFAEVRGGAPAAAVLPTRAPAPQRLLRKPSAAAVALREHMGNTKSGWGQDDLRSLYLGYGFEEREGGKHRFYTHPVFPQLHDSVSRQNDLPPGYAHSALKLLDELDRLTAPAERPAELVAPHDGPPATLRLEELAVLLSPPGKPAPRAAPEAASPRVAAKPRPAAARAPAASPKKTPAKAPPLAPELAPYTPAAEEAARPAPPAPAAVRSGGWGDWLARLKGLVYPPQP